MLREKNQVIVRMHLVLDVAISVAAFIGAYFSKKYLLTGCFGGLSTEPNYYYLLFLVMILWSISFLALGFYDSYRRRTLFQILFNVVQAVGFSLLAFGSVMYLLDIPNVSRGMMVLFGVLNVVMLWVSKTLVFFTLRRIREKGYNIRSVLVVGCRERARDVIKPILSQKWTGYRVQGCLDVDESSLGDEVVEGVRVIGSIHKLEGILKQNIVDELVFAMPMKLIPNASRYLSMAEEMGVSVRIVPDWQIHDLCYKPHIATVGFETFLEIPTMKFNTITTNDVALMFKHVLDYLLASLILLGTLPFFIAVAMAIKLFSPGPVFYKQNRMGMNGRLFEIYKFRTMVVGADKMLDQLKAQNEADGPAFKIRKDPRVIPWVGTLLRKTSMDELPQLINVFRGEMSLIGPRPPIPSEVEAYELWQRRRLSMKPGMTCIWQVTPNRNDVSFNGWMKMDLEYIDNWSLSKDLKILFATIRAVLTGAGR